MLPASTAIPAPNPAGRRGQEALISTYGIGTKGLPHHLSIPYTSLEPGGQRKKDGVVAARSLDLEQARRLEKGLVAVRWFAVAFALFQVSQDNAIRPVPPPATQPRGFVLVVVLALGNLVIWQLTRQARDLGRMRHVGYAAFALDMAVCVGMVWNYSYCAHGTSWVIAYILPLEGAIRYQLLGALAPTLVSAISEGLRARYLTAKVSHYSH